MRSAEARLATDLADAGWQVVLNGPLNHLRSLCLCHLVAGYVQSHHRQLFPDDLQSRIDPWPAGRSTPGVQSGSKRELAPRVGTRRASGKPSTPTLGNDRVPRCGAAGAGGRLRRPTGASGGWRAAGVPSWRMGRTRLLDRGATKGWLGLLAWMIAAEHGDVLALVGDASVPVCVLDSCLGEVIVASGPMRRLFLDDDGSAPFPVNLLVPDAGLVATLADLLVSGGLDAYEARRDYRAIDGSVFVADALVAVFDRDDRSRALCLLNPIDEEPRPSLPTSPPAPGSGNEEQLVVGRFDAAWKLESVSRSVESALGYPPDALIGSSFLDLVHPADLGEFFSAAGRALVEARAVSLPLRVSRRGGDVTVLPCLLLPLAGAPARFAFTLSAVDVGAGAATDPALFGWHLRRIAEAVSAAGVAIGAHLEPTPELLPGVEGLSSRQREVLRRLALGERVASIAAGLHVSQSTVRNHLCAIFAKVGVHSQDELLRLLRNSSNMPAPLDEEP